MAAVNADAVIGFEAAAGPLRSELLAHCYRILGTWDEAEDAVQETYLRGWRAGDGFEQRSSERIWLHRIATNVCLNAIRDRGRRALPSGIGAPAEDVSSPSEVLPPETWVQPIASDRSVHAPRRSGLTKDLSSAGSVRGHRDRAPARR